MKGALISLGALAAMVTLVGLVVAGGTTAPDGPVPVVWDREPCAHCHMAVGEPRHAVQLVTTDTHVLNFDDVGCAVAYVRKHGPAVHRLWFHGAGERWIPSDAVGFIKTAVTPMGSGLLAVDAGTPDAQTFADLLRDYREPTPGGHP